MVRVLYFAGARERTGVSSEDVALDGCSVGDARALLATRHARLNEVMHLCRFAVDQAFATDDTLLRAGAELAVIPPVAGG